MSFSRIINNREVFDEILERYTGYISRRTALRYVDTIAYQSNCEGYIVLRVTRIKGRLGSACFVGLEAPESARELRTTRTEPICPAGILLTRYQPLLNCIHVLESSVLPDTSSNWDSRKNRRTNVVIQYFRVLIISNILYLRTKILQKSCFENLSM